jgi:hypothetical protein
MDSKELGPLAGSRAFCSGQFSTSLAVSTPQGCEYPVYTLWKTCLDSSPKITYHMISAFGHCSLTRLSLWTA